MPRITICLPVYNGSDYIEEALASIAAQTCSDYIVVASNNASSDDTGAILQKWAKRIPIEIVTRDKTIPMQAHFDSLLDLVKTESYMLLCHDDYLCATDALQQGLDALDAHPEVSAIYCDLAYVSERGRTLATRRFQREGPMNADLIGEQSLRAARNMFGIPLLVRSSALGCHRYDRQFKYIVDVDLSWTISKNSPAWHIPEVMIANRYSASNSTWGMLKDASKEFFALAHKHGIALSPLERKRIGFTNWHIGVQKQVFGVYERVRTRMGASIMTDGMSPALVLRYLSVGTFNTAVGYGVYCFMLTLGLNFAGASFISLIFGIFLSFVTLGRYVFLSQLKGRFAKFLSVWAVLYIFNIAAIAAGMHLGANAYLAGLIAAVPTLSAAFLFQRFYVFNDTEFLS